MAELDTRRTEVRSKAARSVQSRFRAHVAREKFLALRNISISFQSFVRGNVLLIDTQAGIMLIALVELYAKSFSFSHSNIGL
jgi:hypothetical protein